MSNHDFITTILEVAKRHPDKVALSKGKTSYSYQDLSESVTAVAANLAENGMKPGDRVFFSVSPDAKGLILALGVIAGGGAIVFADPGTAPQLFKERVDLSQPSLVVAESVLYFANTKLGKYICKKKGFVVPDYNEINAQHYYAGYKLPGTPKDALSLKGIYKTDGKILPVSDPDQESILVFTSGTTSDPKCVRHSRNTIGSGMQAFVEKCGINEDSWIYTDHFNFGITALTVGGHWEIPENPPAKDVSKWVKALSQKQVSHTFLVPADVTLMLDEIERKGITVPLKSLSMGAAPVLPSLIKRVQKVMPATQTYAIYGMTEILPIAIIPGDEKVEYLDGDIAGQIQPGIIATIDDTVTIDGKATMSNGKLVGELLVSGPSLMLGYLGKEPTEVHRTGDMATIDNDGNLVLLGRIKDMLIRGNKNIYPGLYEPLISLIPGVESSAIVGIQDKYGEDIVVLVVVPVDKNQADKDFRKSIAEGLIQAIDSDSQPDVIIVSSELPLTGRSNKPDRVKLREIVYENYRVQHLLKSHG